MKKRDKILSWLIGVSLVIIIILVYLPSEGYRLILKDILLISSIIFDLNGYKLVLIGSAVALASAIICWSLALKIKSSGIIAYSIGFIFGFFGLVGYLIYYFIKRIFLNKEEELEAKEKEKMDKKLGIEDGGDEKK